MTRSNKVLRFGTDSLNRVVSLPMEGERLTNYHFATVGGSGNGKTALMRYATYQVSKMEIPVIIIDSSKSYVPDGEKDPWFFSNVSINYAYKEGIALDFLQRRQLDEDTKEKVVDVAMRVAQMLCDVIKIKGEMQQIILYDAIKTIMSTDEHADISKKLDLLQIQISKSKSPAAKSLLLKLKRFIDQDVFVTSNEVWNAYAENLKIFNIQHFDTSIKRMLADTILWEIWDQAVKKGNPDNKIIVLLDEAQTFNHSGNSPIAKILTEGRKFGIGLWLSMPGLNSEFDDDALARIGQVATEIYFRPVAADLGYIAKSLDYETSNQWKKKLQELQRGEGIIRYTENTDNGPTIHKRRVRIDYGDNLVL